MAEGASSSDAKHRVKLYRLNQEEQWLDMGTGNVFAQMSTRGDTWSFHVRSESGTSMLIEHTIDSSIEYQKQSETILVWRDPDTQKDVALSFQLPAGCTELWDKIQHSLQASSNVLVGEEIGLEREEVWVGAGLVSSLLHLIPQIFASSNTVSLMCRIAVECRASFQSTGESGSQSS